MYDLAIVGGLVVDGTGTPPRRADVGVRDGRIVRVADSLDGPAAETVDATGLLVTPGFVDVHTHYDGQVTWDTALDPSASHGVTTVVAGNCGVGFAPVKPGKEDWLIGLMEGVEDIPGSALAEGVAWNWESFPEYLDAVADRELAVDFGVQIAHGPLRAYVMGERGARNEPATPDDIARMAELVTEAVRAGALGFSTSRTLSHRAIDGEPVPGTFATEDELFALGKAAAKAGRVVFELAPMGATGEDVIAAHKEMDWMRRLAAETGLPVTFSLLQVDAAPEQWRELLAESLAACEAGAEVYPQVAGRPFGMLVGFTGRHAFTLRPAFQDLAARYSGRDLLDRLAAPEVRAAILADADLDPRPGSMDDMIALGQQFLLDRIFPLGEVPDYEPTPDMSLAALAAAEGVDPMGKLYDLMLEQDGRAMLMVPIFGYSDGDHEALREMLLHPAAVYGLADGGAHVAMVCDASMPTYLLTHWARDRTRGEKLPLEYVIRKQTSDTARLFGLTDRGVVAEGMRADLNVIDFANLTLDVPRMAHDLPAGGGRLLQDAHGYTATIVAGVITRRNDKDTGARPGRLLRGTR
ncbi:N-acyl-D-amino-acid deacylase family protein [Actinocorallia sp. A-T 12471]|uniref:N-acyl-D-amino-acid deacylase family protein n=1 Tax=Actinocorallia sp. A-T 12471 TaxID=3089813 RepID=UPI0029CB8209|nr:amidohydrolase family protein [Actinocorallia sp. A-T 12471]MDX6740929.1 amidohydrolase family protein [Actinocorallia sp. A-T 12471]